MKLDPGVLLARGQDGAGRLPARRSGRTAYAGLCSAATCRRFRFRPEISDLLRRLRTPSPLNGRLAAAIIGLDPLDDQ